MAESPFEKGWWGIELPGARPCDGTYCFFDAASLPHLDESLFRGEFQWLANPPKWVTVNSAYRAPDEDDEELDMVEVLAVLRAEAEQANLALPPEFIRFMGNADLQKAIPSCTACEFELGELIPSVVEEGAYTLLFLRDQQSVLLWYLYLTSDGKSSVICSPIPFDDPEMDEPVHVIKAHTLEVAPSFEAFLYRFWIENRIWFVREENRTTLPFVLKAYVDHYL